MIPEQENNIFDSTIGFGLDSHWLRKQMRNYLSFATQLKTALYCDSYILLVHVKLENKKTGKIYYFSTFRGHRDSIIKRLVK